MLGLAGVPCNSIGVGMALCCIGHIAVTQRRAVVLCVGAGCVSCRVVGVLCVSVAWGLSPGAGRVRRDEPQHGLVTLRDGALPLSNSSRLNGCRAGRAEKVDKLQGAAHTPPPHQFLELRLGRGHGRHGEVAGTGERQRRRRPACTWRRPIIPPRQPPPRTHSPRPRPRQSSGPGERIHQSCGGKGAVRRGGG